MHSTNLDTTMKLKMVSEPNLKGPFLWKILTIVGLESNNGDDLDLSPLSNFTFIIDIQKMFLVTEYKFCHKHIYENIRKTWRTKEYKDNLWKYIIVITVQEFNHPMRGFDSYNKKHMNGMHNEDDLHMIKVQHKCVGPLTPSSTKIVETNKQRLLNTWKRPWKGRHVVEIDQRVCRCRKLELTRIPCRHVLAVQFDKPYNDKNVGELYTYVHNARTCSCQRRK
uniref:SWIM-type domain-containing protein n=1 Tax=Lactuca sativa TaxID=4236 RepID=A0A9R1UGB5_LACSA|nr:hypothetical protein LSAT_V11C900459290 [Lactuca sativa]